MSELSVGEDKPFRSESENDCWDRRVPVHIRVGHPNVSPHVVPIAGRQAPLSPYDFVTSFLVSWKPAPPPPPHWVKLLREAPFGAGTVHARDLHWNGSHLSIELVHEADVEGFAMEMPTSFSLDNSPIAGLGVFEDFRVAAGRGEPGVVDLEGPVVGVDVSQIAKKRHRLPG